MQLHPPIQTGQTDCYDTYGQKIACEDSSQDGEFRFGVTWPEPRFEVMGSTVLDLLTSLTWPINANINDFPLTWQEALDLIKEMNREEAFGFSDWRLPNRREMHSLMSYETKKPSLPLNHPFKNFFLGWYWTSTSAAINTAYAWYIHMEGARMFYGRKDQYYLLWPVRGTGNQSIQKTGQSKCYNTMGEEIPCIGSGQDGEFCHGINFPGERFAIKGSEVIDQLTGLTWLCDADLSGMPVSWPDALAEVAKLNAREVGGRQGWRLPNINELESLVDCSQHSPALPVSHPFTNLKDIYWSSTTSFFETDWAWALYLDKGALGVGYKREKNFYIWPVASG